MLDIGRVGIWTRQLEDQPAARAQEAAAELEELGYSALWFGEALGREAFTNAGLLLAGTRKIRIATGIANIYARDPMAMAAAHKTLSEAYPGRFILGLGVSHASLVEEVRGHKYDRPVPTMRAYLDAMDAAPYRSIVPPARPVRVLAALGPKMLELARDRTDGAHPYNVNPEHTAEARRILGRESSLCPEQAVLLESDPAKARQMGRTFLDFYLKAPNYTNNFVRLGFSEADFRNGGSDRLIDSIVAWGNLQAIRNRVRAHHDAGANHVCIQVLTADPRALPLTEWRELASALIPK
jgi:probable F420-dependent oxidoreductase